MTLLTKSSSEFVLLLIVSTFVIKTRIFKKKIGTLIIVKASPKSCSKTPIYRKREKRSLHSTEYASCCEL